MIVKINLLKKPYHATVPLKPKSDDNKKSLTFFPFIVFMLGYHRNHGRACARGYSVLVKDPLERKLCTNRYKTKCLIRAQLMRSML